MTKWSRTGDEVTDSAGGLPLGRLPAGAGLTRTGEGVVAPGGFGDTARLLEVAFGGVALAV